MVVSILVVDDDPTVALLFRQCFRREARASSHVMYFARCCEDALHPLRTGVKPLQIGRASCRERVLRLV